MLSLSLVPVDRLLVCKSEKRSRVPLYSIFIDPSNFNNFAISGRDQFARSADCVVRDVCTR